MNPKVIQATKEGFKFFLLASNGDEFGFRTIEERNVFKQLSKEKYTEINY